MPNHILFIQGAGEAARSEDTKLVDSLCRELGPEYKIAYPPMPHEENPSYSDWKEYLKKELVDMKEPLVFVAHSVGASILLKWLSERTDKSNRVAGIFILAAPFWGGEGWRYEGYKDVELPADAADKLPKSAPVFFYQCHDDEIVPIEHLALFKELFPHATERQLTSGGHQFNNDLSLVARDIEGIIKHLQL